MQLEEVTNKNWRHSDWAAIERAKFLQSIPPSKSAPSDYLALGLPSDGLIGIDLSGRDRRSVKAQLRGRGSFRAMWWEFFRAIHHVAVPNVSLEQVMYRSHRGHHIITLWRRDFLVLHREVTQVMLQDGVVAGLAFAMQSAIPAPGDAK